MLPDMIRRGRDPQVGITVHGATITLRITAAGETAEECFRRMEPTVATIHECLGDLVFGEGEDELENAVVRLLKLRQKTLATAEWGSGGMIAHWLSEAAGNEHTFIGGVVVRSVEALLPLIHAAAAAKRGAQEEEQLIAAMARACRENFGADYGLAVGELPQVNPTASEPPLLYFAVATPSEIVVKSSPFAGHPDILKMRGGKQALNLLRLTLLRAESRT
jgi:nicotinamide-nucleotide amidase